ncbi:hypothetical protein V8C34DRAFT_301096 [Trichoderma compactum]
MQKTTEKFIKCPFTRWRKPVASILPTVTAPVSSEQSATITTPEQDVTPAAIESPEGNAVPTTTTPSDDKVDASDTWIEFWRRLFAKSWLLGPWGTLTSTPSTEEVGTWRTPEDIWRGLLENGLKKKKLGHPSDLLTYSSCAQKISQMCTEYEERADTKFLTTIKPVVEGLLVCSPGITPLAEADKLVPLVWGSVQIFLESAKGIYSVSSSIQALLDGLEAMLPRLKEYVDLCPDNKRLRELGNLLWELCLACYDGRRFADAMDKLEKHEWGLHREADLASARHVKDIHTAVSGRAPDLMAPTDSQSSIYEQHP